MLTRLVSLTLPTAALVAAVGSGILVAFAFKPEPASASPVPRVKIALGKPGPANRLHLGAANLAAGDRMERPFDLRGSGKHRIGYVALTTRALRSSALDRDRRHGLRLRIDRCTGAWKKMRNRRRYLCAGRVSHVVAERPVIVSAIALRGVRDVLRAGKVAHLRVTLTLPRTAPSRLGGAVSRIRYTFTASETPR